MTRVLLVGVGAERADALVKRLDAAGFAAELWDGGAEPADSIEALLVGAAPAGKPFCPQLKCLGCADHRLPMIAETGSLCTSACEVATFAGPNHYTIDDLMSPALPQLLATAVAQHREIARLRHEVETRASAIGLIMGGLFQVRTLEEAGALSTMLSLACPDPSRVVVGLRELIVNAIEHGNLAISCEEKGELIREGKWQAEVARRLTLPEYRDRRATVQFRLEDRRAIIQVRDEGAGFDYSRYLRFDPARLAAPNGRGIAMALAMSFDTLTYIGCGNDVIAITKFDNAKAEERERAA